MMTMIMMMMLVMTMFIIKMLIMMTNIRMMMMMMMMMMMTMTNMMIYSCRAPQISSLRGSTFITTRPPGANMSQGIVLCFLWWWSAIFQDGTITISTMTKLWYFTMVPITRAVLVDLEPGTMDSVRSGPYGQVNIDHDFDYDYHNYCDDKLDND